MKNIILFTILLTLLGCDDKESLYDLPTFASNSSIDEVWDPVQSVSKEMDVVVAYAISGGLSATNKFSVRIFAKKNSTWHKIEIIGGMLEADTLYESDGEFVSKEIRLNKECRDEDASKFLNELVSLGLFEIGEERELLEDCKKLRDDHSVPQSTDASSILFYIIKADRVRTLSYYDPWQKQKDCPNKKEWNTILQLSELFEKEWYLKKHY